MSVSSKSDPFALNISGVRNLVESPLNKVKGNGPLSSEEGLAGDKIDVLDLPMSDGELLDLAKKWDILYTTYESKIKLRQQANETFYKGRQKLSTPQGMDDSAAISANLLFEAIETFLPAALSRNPDPVVWSDNSPQGNAVADSVRTMLQYHSDSLGLRSKLSLMTRKWALDFLGVLKHGWDNDIQEIKTEVRDVKNFIFDPSGYVDVYGCFTSYLGERMTVTAERLIEMFPKKKDMIVLLVDGKLGTPVTYTEWWTDEYCFYTFKDVVLDKHKNPHFNYSRDGQDEVTDEGGNIIQPAIEEIQARNHFAKPMKPYTFLSVFNLQQQPHDETGLIEQNIPNQRLITRRTEQIDYNLSRANNSTVFSERNFTQETAKQAATAWTRGHPVLVPEGGPINEAIKDFPPPSIPDAFFKELDVNMNNLRSIFGVQGITAAKQDEDQTARGMILNQQYDNSRIGGGIGDKLEMVARNVFNWWVQLYYVYYDEAHYAAVMGQLKATEYIELSSAHLNANLIVSVSPDSMKPHDEVTNMNQALSLWEAGAIDPLTLLTRLNFPSPKETAGMFMLYKLNPQAYFMANWPDMAQAIMPQPAAPGAPAPTGAPNPEAQSEPAPPIGGVPATASLSSVPLPS
ncbi:MAG: hypothetical protein KGI66_02525 [Patescibacteria group bacterium]|nr:hypothetical protein [Patescibacteria group bacterium]